MREKMVDMWEVVVGVNDETVDTDSDDENEYVAIVEEDPVCNPRFASSSSSPNPHLILT